MSDTPAPNPPPSVPPGSAELPTSPEVELFGTFACPHCGLASPHHHDTKSIAAWGDKRAAMSLFEQAWPVLVSNIPWLRHYTIARAEPGTPRTYQSEDAEQVWHWWYAGYAAQHAASRARAVADLAGTAPQQPSPEMLAAVNQRIAQALEIGDALLRNGSEIDKETGHLLHYLAGALRGAEIGGERSRAAFAAVAQQRAALEQERNHLDAVLNDERVKVAALQRSVEELDRRLRRSLAFVEDRQDDDRELGTDPPKPNDWMRLALILRGDAPIEHQLRRERDLLDLCSRVMWGPLPGHPDDHLPDYIGMLKSDLETARTLLRDFEMVYAEYMAFKPNVKGAAFAVVHRIMADARQLLRTFAAKESPDAPR